MRERHKYGAESTKSGGVDRGGRSYVTKERRKRSKTTREKAKGRENKQPLNTRR